MKNILFTLALLISFSSFSQMDAWKEKVFKGNIKSITEYTGSMSGEDSKKVYNNPVELYSTKSFNEMGLLISEEFNLSSLDKRLPIMDFKETVALELHYYNEENLLNKSEGFNIEDDLIYRTDYYYDSDLNIIKENKHIYSNNELVEFLSGVGKYDTNNNLIEMNWTKDSKFFSSFKFSYDKSNNLIEEISYNNDGTVYIKISTSYNDKNQELKSSIHIPEFTEMNDNSTNFYENNILTKKHTYQNGILSKVYEYSRKFDKNQNPIRVETRVYNRKRDKAPLKHTMTEVMEWDIIYFN